jgi:hypothetical protein
MLQELKTLRKKIATEIQVFEKDLYEARNSAALGGSSRAFLLHLQRKVHGSKKQLALLDAQMESVSAHADAPCRAPTEAKTGEALSSPAMSSRSGRRSLKS